METNFMGKEGFIWAVGVVEDRFDPLYLGRCRVRWLGWHTKNKEDLPVSALPWAFPMLPITSASQTGVGTSPTGPVEGTWVFGFFRDGTEANDPVMIGTLGGRPDKPCNPNEGFNDPRDYHVKEFYHVNAKTGELVTADTEHPDVPQHPLSVVRDKEDGAIEIKERSDRPTIEAGQQREENTLEGEAGEVKAEFLQLGTETVEERLPAYEYNYNYPLKRFLGEPTTPRLARGMKDGSTKILYKMGTLADGSMDVKQEGDSNSIVQRKAGLRLVDNFTIPGKGGPDGNKQKLEEPQPAYTDKVLYPYNHVHQSESGHVIEIDDSPAVERLHWYHRSGSYREMHSLGKVVDKSNEDYWSCVMRDSHEMVGASKYSSIKGGWSIDVNTTGGDEDFYLRVRGPGGGDVIVESEAGNVEMYTKKGIAFINARRIELNATQEVVINTPLYNQTQFPQDEPSLHGGPMGPPSITSKPDFIGSTGTKIKRKGSFYEIITGEKGVTAGRISFNTMGAFGLSAQGLTETISHRSEETITGQHILQGDSGATKSITTIHGHINLKSGGALTGTGGIVLQLNDNPKGIKKTPAAATGFFEILPSAGNATASDIMLSSSLGNIMIKNKVAEFSMTQSPQGNILLASHGRGGTAEIRNSRGFFRIESSGSIAIRNEVASLKKIIESFIEDYLQHSHPVTGAVVCSVGGGPIQPGAMAEQMGGVPVPPKWFYGPTKAQQAQKDLNSLFYE